MSADPKTAETRQERARKKGDVGGGPLAADLSAVVGESWRPLSEFTGYEVSSFGRIRSLPRVGLVRYPDGRSYSRPYPGIILKPQRWAPRRGLSYFHVLLTRLDGTRKCASVNVLVCEAFHGPKPSADHQAAHLDGDHLNNRADNLAWKTRSENEADKHVHGTAIIGRRNPQARLVEASIPVIFEQYLATESCNAVAERWGISAVSIHSVITRKLWKHVPIPPEIIRSAQEVMRANAGNFGRHE